MKFHAKDVEEILGRFNVGDGSAQSTPLELEPQEQQPQAPPVETPPDTGGTSGASEDDFFGSEEGEFQEF